MVFKRILKSSFTSHCEQKILRRNNFRLFSLKTKTRLLHRLMITNATHELRWLEAHICYINPCRILPVVCINIDKWACPRGMTGTDLHRNITLYPFTNIHTLTTICEQPYINNNMSATILIFVMNTIHTIYRVVGT